VYHNASDAAHCCQLCLADSMCSFYSYNLGRIPHGGENCWLKTSDAGRHSSSHSISGSVGRIKPKPRPPPPPPRPPPPPAPPPPPPGIVRRACSGDGDPQRYRFCDTSLPAAERAADLVSRLTLDEKPALMTARHSAPIDRLGVPAYDWGVNSIHGNQVQCGTRCATNYPLPIGVAASWNRSLVFALSNMMAVELRALRLEHSCEQAKWVPHPPATDACIGLDTWAPNINLNRDPRWCVNVHLFAYDPHSVMRADAVAGGATGNVRVKSEFR
jgi:hypothetical protein